MTRLIQLVLLVTWVVGAVTGGLTVQPDGPGPRSAVRVVSEMGWARLTVQAERIVVAVGRDGNRWQAAAPIPAFAENWLRDVIEAVPESRRESSLERAFFIPL